MILDSHVHFWHFDPVRDSWITNDMKVIQQDFLPAHLEPLFSQNGVDGCVAVQASQSVAETEFLLALADEHSFIKGVVGWVDLKAPDIEEQLQRYVHFDKLKGFRHIAEGEPRGFLLQPDVINGIRAVGQHGFSYDILVCHEQLQDAAALADRLPNQPFVIDHCAKPNLRDNDITAWLADIKALAQHPNVYCKLSGLLTQCHWDNHDEAAIFKCLDVIFESFGIGRVMYGSDWPVMLLAGNYHNWLEAVTKYTGQFTAEEKEMVFYKNTGRYYNL